MDLVCLLAHIFLLFYLGKCRHLVLEEIQVAWSSLTNTRRKRESHNPLTATLDVNTWSTYLTEDQHPPELASLSVGCQFFLNFL